MKRGGCPKTAAPLHCSAWRLLRGSVLRGGAALALAHELEELLPLGQSPAALLRVGEHLPNHPRDGGRAEVELLVELLHRLEHLAPRQPGVLDWEVLDPINGYQVVGHEPVVRHRLIVELRPRVSGRE